jgi:two-component system, NarL family, response regulator NreC
MVTLVLADDHNLVRQGVRALLEAESDFTVIGEAGDGTQAVAVVESLHPDVLVIDAAMPGLNGIEAAKQVKQRSPNTRVLVLSMYANEGYVLQALRNGADGYVLKDETASVLVQAVHDVLAGRRYLSPPISERAIDAYIQKAESVTQQDFGMLTAREREILQLAAEGNSNANIAQRLSISPRTAETHRTNLMRKLGLKNQTDLIRYAIRSGVLPMEQ